MSPYHQFVLVIAGAWLAFSIAGFCVGCFVDRFPGDQADPERVALAAFLSLLTGPIFLLVALIVASAGGDSADGDIEE